MDIDNLINDEDSNYIPKHSQTLINRKNNKKKRVVVKRKRRRKNNKWLIFLIFIFIGIIVFSLFKIIKWNEDNKKTDEITKIIEVATEVVEVEDTPDTEIVNEEEDINNPYWYYVSFPLINVDLNELKNINNDTVGWINVNNTNINYPFVHTSDNDFYLNHSFDKRYNEAGWLFLDYRNSGDFSDKNNIIYAHSRLDKTMFGSLSRVLKSDWYNDKDNHIIRLSLENENTLWQIFSVYKIKTETYYITTNFNSDNEYLDFLDTIKNRSLYDFSVNLSKNDKILTLSTCYSDTERTVVHARLIKRSSK